MYQELVVEAESALEQAAGEEFVFLLWVGMLRSLRMRGYSQWRQGQPQLNGDHPDMEITSYLQLGLAKQRVAMLLLRVREWHARWAQARWTQNPVQPAARPVAAPQDAARLPAGPARMSGPAARPPTENGAAAGSAPLDRSVHRLPDPIDAREPRQIVRNRLAGSADGQRRPAQSGRATEPDRGIEPRQAHGPSPQPLPEGEGAAGKTES